ncbi:MAG: hypothetical protein IJV06_06675 [Bacteroidaceae bacterium]|nr:hypothetical protein [Bacteroidaceae bacterium]
MIYKNQTMILKNQSVIYRINAYAVAFGVQCWQVWCAVRVVLVRCVGEFGVQCGWGGAFGGLKIHFGQRGRKARLGGVLVGICGILFQVIAKKFSIMGYLRKKMVESLRCIQKKVLPLRVQKKIELFS